MISSNYSTLPIGQPQPNAALKSLPVVVREKVEDARLPVQYDDAVKALAACTTIDESKHWADKAEALAAWAKVYKDDKVAIEARRLKLHAYRRMGQIAEEMRPTKLAVHERGKLAQPKGAQSLLKEHGLSHTTAAKALRISRAPAKDFDASVERAEGVSAASQRFRGLGRCRGTLASDAWLWLQSSTMGPFLSNVRTKLRSRPAKDVAFLIAPGEVKAARALALELIEWLDEFEQALPKDGE